MAGKKSRLDSSVNPYSSLKKTKAMRTLDEFIDIKNVSPAQIKGSNPPNFKYIDKNGAVKSTGKYASGADVTGRMMRGTDEVAPTESEIMEMGGFEIRKAGGSVKKKKKKKKKTRAVGVGKALRGYGAVRKG